MVAKTVRRPGQRGAGSLPVKTLAGLSNHRSWLFYGRAGTGKTTLAGTFPGPILLIDVKDRGTDSVSDVKNLKVLEADSYEEVEEAFWWLKANPKAYGTVVIDHLTQLQQVIIEEVAGGKKKKGNKNLGDWGTMTKQDWGEVSALMKSLITNFRDLPMNVVFLAQDRVFNLDDDTDASVGEIDPEVGPRLSPATSSHLCAAVSVIGNTFIRSRTKSTKTATGKTKTSEAIEYCLRLGPSPAYITKIRKPKTTEIPSFLVDPTYDELIDIIEGA